MSGKGSRRAVMLAAGGAAAWVAAGPTLRARAQSASPWPSQPIRLVVPFAPGGTTDLVARLIGQGLSERLGQPVVIENRAGAGATVGSQAVAAAAPDGLTLLMSNIAGQAISPTLYRSVRYDPLRDFAHVALLVTAPSVWVANPQLPARSLAEVVARAREDPGGLDIASSGSGSSNHLLIVLMAQRTGTRFNHVPYRGAGPAMTDVIAGVVPMMSDSLPSSVAHIRQGSVRAIAVSAEARHPAFPDVPTFREAGFDLVSTSWFGLSAPAGTAAPVVERLAAEAQTVLDRPATRARLAEIGATPGRMGPAAYAAFIGEELARWAPVVRASGAQVD